MRKLRTLKSWIGVVARRLDMIMMGARTVSEYMIRRQFQDMGFDLSAFKLIMNHNVGTFVDCYENTMTFFYLEGTVRAYVQSVKTTGGGYGYRENICRNDD